METRVLGRTNLEVSVLGCGGGAFYDPNMSGREVSNIMSYLAHKGVNLFETAEDYDEKKLADGLKRLRDDSHDIILTTKSTASGDEMAASIDRSLDNLGVSHIHIYQMQTITGTGDLKRRLEGGAMDALQEARSQGKIGFIGFSSHRLDTVIAGIKTGKFDVVELSYCIGSHAAEEAISLAAEHNVGVIAISPLGGGILIDRDKKSGAGFMNTENALKWVLHNKNVATALVGMSTVEHAWENVRAAYKTGSDDEIRAIEGKALNFLGNFCRSCKSCMPCDEHGWQFSIDNFFRFRAFFERYGYRHFNREYQRLPILADRCTGCGKCEPRCPYNIKIMEGLKKTHELLK
ncbi:MAG: aldo/keto reductase [archaeon]